MIIFFKCLTYLFKAANTSSCPLILQLTLQLLQLDVWCPVAAVAAVPGVTGLSKIVTVTPGIAATAAMIQHTSSCRSCRVSGQLLQLSKT